MRDGSSVIDPFHRSLHSALMEELHKRVDSIASGAAKNFEDYKEKIGYIKALNDSLDKCKEIETEMYGLKPGEDQE